MTQKKCFGTAAAFGLAAVFLFTLMSFSGCRKVPALLQKNTVCEFRQLPFSLITVQRDRKNGVEAVFVEEKINGTVKQTEVSVVFLDEDQPFFLFDWIYDGYRFKHYRPKRDIETFFVYSSADQIKPDSIVFPGTYSAAQKFRKDFVKHHSAVVSSFSCTDKRGCPVIYVNTWNHLFSEKDNNPRLKKDTACKFAVITGNRDSAEKFTNRAK